VSKDVNRFCGINGSRLQVLGIFHGDIEIHGVRTKIKFYTVPDGAIAFKMLLGKDFLSCPLLRVTLGNTVEIESAHELDDRQVLNITVSEHTDNPCYNELQINPAMEQSVGNKIREIYESCYLGNFQSKERESDFEMNIVLKHDQPISSRPHRLSYTDKETLREILDGLLKKNVIRPSNSPYASISYNFDLIHDWRRVDFFVKRRV